MSQSDGGGGGANFPRRYQKCREYMIEFSLQWNLDVKKAQATGKICLL